MRRAQNGRQISMFKIAAASASLLLVAGVADANDCSGDTPQECSCSYTFSNGFTITSSVCCSGDQACSCTVIRNGDGSIIGVKARCITATNPSPIG